MLSYPQMFFVYFWFVHSFLPHNQSRFHLTAGLPVFLSLSCPLSSPLLTAHTIFHCSTELLWPSISLRLTASHSLELRASIFFSGISFSHFWPDHSSVLTHPLLSFIQSRPLPQLPFQSFTYSLFPPPLFPISVSSLCLCPCFFFPFLAHFFFFPCLFISLPSFPGDISPSAPPSQPHTSALPGEQVAEGVVVVFVEGRVDKRVEERVGVAEPEENALPYGRDVTRTQRDDQLGQEKRDPTENKDSDQDAHHECCPTLFLLSPRLTICLERNGGVTRREGHLRLSLGLLHLKGEGREEGGEAEEREG